MTNAIYESIKNSRANTPFRVAAGEAISQPGNPQKWHHVTFELAQRMQKRGAIQ